MHRVISSSISHTSRQIDSQGKLVTREQEVETQPFSVRTPRISRKSISSSPSQLSSPINYSARPKTQISVKKNQSSVLVDLNSRQGIRDFSFQGLHTTNIKKKDDTIQSLESLALNLFGQVEGLKSNENRLNNKISSLEANLEAFKKTSDTFQMMSERFSHLSHLNSFQSDQGIIDEIKQIELDAQKYIHLSEPWRLNEIIEGNSTSKTEELVDLKFKRLEDLIYGLRRQLIQDQDLIALIPTINSRFGSVQNLLLKYDESQEVIQKLKTREIRFNSDELIKRRPLSEYNIQSLQVLVVSLQNELTEYKSQLRKARQFSRILNSSKNEKLESQNDDFNTKEESSQKQELDEAQQKIIQLQSQIQILEANNQELQNENKRMESDIETLVTISNLETDVLNKGIFLADDHLKEKLQQTQNRIKECHETFKKMHGTISLQESLIRQNEREKNVAQRRVMDLSKSVIELEEKLNSSKESQRMYQNIAKSLRGINRIIAEFCLIKCNGYEQKCKNIEESFFPQFQRCDNAAYLIQTFWRSKKHRNRDHERFAMNVWRNTQKEFPWNPILNITSTDVLIGNLPPLQYKQIVGLLKSFNRESRLIFDAFFNKMKHTIENVHQKSINAIELCTVRPKRHNFSQTENNYDTKESQTEKNPLVRKSKN